MQDLPNRKFGSINGHIGIPPPSPVWRKPLIPVIRILIVLSLVSFSLPLSLLFLFSFALCSSLFLSPLSLSIFLLLPSPFFLLSFVKIVLILHEGISGFVGNPEGLREAMEELIDYAEEKIPEEQHAYTPLFLKATAGMRLLPEEEQEEILSVIREVFDNSPFRFDEGSWASVISGQSCLFPLPVF